VNAADVATLDWQKGAGLLPAVVQDSHSGSVLMLGFMNADALRRTLAEGRVTFFSRSRGRLWTKGESSGHFILVDRVSADCDRDTVLIQGRATGPVCHTGTASCFPEQAPPGPAELGFLQRLEQIIDSRIAGTPGGSYTARLVGQGPNRVAQKVGEEGLEVALAAVAGDTPALIGESADLLFHLLLLLRSRGQSLAAVVRELEARHAVRGAAREPGVELNGGV
jgi:phosphoribosyl-ATP pyrophosphohydrolase/phosphoribosyl-AMP cyclohydrolase